MNEFDDAINRAEKEVRRLQALAKAAVHVSNAMEEIGGFYGSRSTIFDKGNDLLENLRALR